MRLRYYLMIFTLMGAGACAIFGVHEYLLSARSSREPEEISLRDLINRGPEGNPNIILKDFSIFEGYVYEKKRLSGKWTKVWIPIIPTDGDENASGKPAAIHAFVFSKHVGSEEEVSQWFDRPKLRCMVNPDAPKPGIIGSVLIKRSYPGTDPNKCIILEEGKEPVGPLQLGLFAVGFLFLAGLTGGIWYLARQLDKDAMEPKPADKNQSSGGMDNEEPEPVLDVLPADDVDRRP